MENKIVPFGNFRFSVVSLSQPTNKHYVKIDGQIKKTPSASTAEGDVKVYIKESMEELVEVTQDFEVNDALICSKPINNILEAKITYKGNENIEHNIISRTDDCFELHENGTLLCFDHDPDAELGLVVSSAEDFYQNMIELIPELADCECVITPSSSSLVYDTEEQKPLNEFNGYHLYLIGCNITIEVLKNFIEYLKRKSIELDKFAIKINKDGSTRTVYIYDEMPLKLTQSGLKFETLPTVVSPLVLLEKEYIYKNKGSKNALNLNAFDVSSLPDPSLKINKARLEKKDEIERVKKAYIESKMESVINNYGCSKIEAETIIRKQIETNELNVCELIYTDKNDVQLLWNLLSTPHFEINCADPIEPLKGQGKAILYTNYIFDAVISSRVRGGILYTIDYTLGQIADVLRFQLENHKFTIDKVLKSLAKYIIRKSFPSRDIYAISDLLTDNKILQDKFQKVFDETYVNSKMLELMKNYACITIEPNFFMIDTSKDKLYIIKVSTLKSQLLNSHIKSFFENKYHEPVDLYLKSKQRISYDQIVFKDLKDTKKSEYNFFKGWKYEAKASIDIDFFLNFIFTIIANRNHELYTYILAFISHMFQKPFEKMGTALFINGPQGTGKSFFVNTIGSLMGIHFFATSDPNLIFGRFNSHLLPVILLYPNESFYSGNKADSSKLKNIITETKMPIEQKGIPAFDGFNYSRIILDTNDLHIQHTEKWDRRYVYGETSAEKVGDLQYFSDMAKIIGTKEFKESLMHFFMNFDYKPHEHMLRKAIMTQAKKDQIEESFSPVEKWWLKCLIDGYISNAEYKANIDGTLLIANDSLYGSYLEFCKKINYKYPKGDAQFGRDIHKNLFHSKLIINDKLKPNGKNAKVYASLPLLKEYFTKNYHYDFNINTLNDQWKQENEIYVYSNNSNQGNYISNIELPNIPQGIPLINIPQGLPQNINSTFPSNNGTIFPLS